MVAVDVAGAVRSGDAVDLRELAIPPAELPAPSTLVAAVRDPEDDRVDCPAPGPAHRHVGCITAESSLSLRTAIAAAARSRGARAPQDGEIAALRVARREIDVPDVSLAPAREALAEAEADVETKRERVARLGGAVTALAEAEADRATAEEPSAADDDESGPGPEPGGAADGDPLAIARERHEDAVAALAEAETELVAARQALSAARERARASRDARARRLAVTDRLENRRRGARSTLARAWYERFAAALTGLPGRTEPGDRPAAYEGPDWSAALAVARLASIAAPVVVGPAVADLFADARSVHRTLGAPVVLAAEG